MNNIKIRQKYAKSNMLPSSMGVTNLPSFFVLGEES